MAIIKRSLYLAILCSFLALPAKDFAFAKFEITDENTERISAAFDLLKTFGNMVLPQELKNILNTTVKGVDIGTNITYGVLVLSAANEMELIDMAVSQKYKTQSDKYFKSILNERTNLYKHYKSMAFDIPKILLNTTVTGPISALTLNTFSLESKTIQAILAMHNLNQTMIYNGLWVYFDQRRSNNEHEFAWELAKREIGIANTKTRKSLTTSKTNEESSKIALQFASLWNKWKNDTTAAGVKPEVKQAFNEEMKALALEAASAYAQQKPEPSFFAKLWNNLSNFVEKAKEGALQLVSNISNFLKTVGSYVAKFNPFSAGTVQETPSIQIVKKSAENPVQVGLAQEGKTPSQAKSETKKPPSSNPPAPSSIPSAKKEPAQPANDPVEKEDELGPTESQKKKPQKVPAIEVELQPSCDIHSNASPSLNTVLFNEVAWMGTANSANDEWIELKNISDSSVNLAGWKIRDADEQIHITLENKQSSRQTAFFFWNGQMIQPYEI